MDSTVQQSELHSTSQTSLDARLLLNRLPQGRVMVVDYLRDNLCPRGNFSQADRDLVMYKGLTALVEQTIKVDLKNISSDQNWELALQWDGALTAIVELTGGSLRRAENYQPLREALKQIQEPEELDCLEFFIVNTNETSAKHQLKAQRKQRRHDPVALAVHALSIKIINEVDGRLGARHPPMELAEIVLPDRRSLWRQLGAQLRKAFDQGEEQALDHFRFHACSEAFALENLDRGAVLLFAFRELVNNIEDNFVVGNMAGFKGNAEALNAALGLLEGLEANTAAPFFKALTSVAEERRSDLTGFRFAYKRLPKGARRDLCREMRKMAVNRRWIALPGSDLPEEFLP